MKSAFVEPAKRFWKETYWLEREFARATRSIGPTYRAPVLTAEMAVVRLHDAWARFCREIVILSACGGTETLSGASIGPASGITSRQAVLPKLLGTFKKRRQEPRWADAAECIDAAQRLKVANLLALSAGLGASNSPAEQLRRIRNYYAHRGQATAANAISTGLFATGNAPSVMDLSLPVAGGVTRFEGWIIAFRGVAEAAMQ